MKNTNLLILSLAAIALVGCGTPKSIDSYYSATTKNAAAPGNGDPYSFGGFAGATGGIKSRTSYATDSKSVDPRATTPNGQKAIGERVEMPSTNAPAEPTKGAETKNQPN
jgi:hypothetical protein